MDVPGGLGVKAEIMRHARREAPREACGLLVAAGKKTVAIACRNESDDPENAFRMSPEDCESAEKVGEILACYHSHPNATAEPSDGDIASCEATELPFLVVGWPADEERQTGQLLEERIQWRLISPTGIPIPYERRPFVFGILDCYALMRDWFKRERGVELPNFHRRDNWWHKGENLFLDLFGLHGFHRLRDNEAPMPGDVFLMYVKSPVPNHCAIYEGDGMILHHPPLRLSAREPYVANMGMYARNTFCTLRHESADSAAGV